VVTDRGRITCADVGPIPQLEATRAEIAFPIVHDMDAGMYERQNGGAMEDVLELMPELLDTPGAGVRHGIVHPREQWKSNRFTRLSTFHPRTEALGAVSFEVTGPGACDYLQRMVVTNVDRAVGRVMYTPMLTHNGGFRSDLTVVRRALDRFRVITGGPDWGRDLTWFTDHLPADGSAHIHDITSAWCTAGVWGPRARDIVQSVTDHDLSNEAFPFPIGAAQEVVVNRIPTVMLRMSYVGDLGWEIHAPMEHGVKLWDTLWAAGQPHGMVAAGGGVHGTTGRIEKGYRLMDAELSSAYDPVEPGPAFPKIRAADFNGKAAYIKARESEPIAKMCSPTVEDHMSAVGIKRSMNGGAPILTRDLHELLPSLVTEVKHRRGVG